jgi:outer membrane protease
MTAIAAGLVLVLSLPAFAAPTLDRQAGEGLFGFGLGYMTGNTLYHISMNDATGGIESELEFPLDTMLFGLEGGYVTKNAKGQDAFRIGLQWFRNLSSGSGKLKDSDWLTDNFDIEAPPSPPYPPNSGYPHPGLDIYSESDIALKANIIDLRGSYNNWISDNLSIGPLGGFLYQNYQFDASNLNQVGYGPWAPGYTGSVPGLVLTYEVTYTIPYLGIHSEILVSRSFQAALDLGYSPWAAAEDTDDHVLRGKRSTGTTSGNAYLASVTAQWNIEDNDFFLIRGQYLKIDTTGTQTQTWYRDEIISATETIPAGTTITGINDKITSQQVSLSLLFSHRF